MWCYTGPHDRAEDILAPIREFGSPLVMGLHEMPFTALQSAFDPLYPAGLQWYWRADFFREITDAAIDVHREFGARLPTGHSTMHLYVNFLGDDGQQRVRSAYLGNHERLARAKRRYDPDNTFHVNQNIRPAE